MLIQKLSKKLAKNNHSKLPTCQINDINIWVIRTQEKCVRCLLEILFNIPALQTAALQSFYLIHSSPDVHIHPKKEEARYMGQQQEKVAVDTYNLKIIYKKLEFIGLNIWIDGEFQTVQHLKPKLKTKKSDPGTSVIIFN